ncbi:MAG: AAA family ATPase [Bacteroidetes bacterium]|nr:AAA family ATPase [Bacteroidota bacterium]
MIDKLDQLKAASPDKAEIADYWIKAICEQQTFLDDRTHQIVFIGDVGVGKSSLISVAANLFVDRKPTDKKSLKDKSVLSIGAGRTTICEVRIRSRQKDETGELGLVIDPVNPDEMQKIIAIYAETEWYRRHPGILHTEDDDTEPTPQEIQRAIRNMTGYAEYQELYSEGEKKIRRTVRPLDEIVPGFDTHKALSTHLIERAQLTSRIETKWWWNDCNPENLQALKCLFEDINQGKEPTAMLPLCMNVIVPESYLGTSSDLKVTLVDTRGLESPVESRDDLYKYLKDPRSIILLCAPFKNAPGESLRNLLLTMTADAELRYAIPRTLMVLVDQDDAAQVNGADDDRNFGQDLKIEECYRALERTGLVGEISMDRIIAFDALQDDRNHLQTHIDHCLAELRKRAENQLDKWGRDAQIFIDNASNRLRPELCNTVDKKIKEIMAQYPLPSLPPLHDPLTGLYAAIRTTRYASVVYASCLRNGEYYNLNLYSAVRAKASQEATQWIDKLIDAITARLDDLQKDVSLGLVQDHISLRKKQYLEARIMVISDYADRVKEETHKNMRNNPVWNKCVDEWGGGYGFKNRVVKHLEEWGSRQQDITAHETINATKTVPLLEEASLPRQAPQFRLRVRNLRALRQIDWTPTRLNVLIGANGTGKTTLLLVLKLLRIAYERGLPEAVTQVMGGSSNLRSWGINETEPIEIGIDIDTISWRVHLVPHDGTVDYHASEYLSDLDRKIFFRDALGGFSYAGERIEPGYKLGLKTLMDRGVHEPALRKVASFLQSIAVYHDPDLWTLRYQGSNSSEDRILHSRGGNALTLLRRWHQERVNHHRYRFVVEGLATAFPNIINELDFAEAGNTLTARTYRPGQEHPAPLASEANGVLQYLVLLCNVASAEAESLVAIDEPENSLHPYALRAFLRRTERWARQHNLTVLLATHSTVILDALSASPEQVYVMKTNEPGETLPTRLDKLCNCEWMEGFKLGDLYEQGEIGSNEDEV